MLQRRLEMYQYVAPISPFSVFGLNNKTFCATLATIISYIVVLIKLRGVEIPKTLTNLQAVNETILIWTMFSIQSLKHVYCSKNR